MHSLDPNAIFAGRYRVVRCLAAGGMGAVYEVVHLETERRRALKVMHAHFVQSPELRERFKLEAKVAAHIDSEFIVDVFDAGIEDATQMPFLVMELLKGEELGKLLERVGRLPPADALTYLWQTALALDKTHRANIVHRDLKPENLFLTEREGGPPRIKVLDFGIAKFVAETGTSGATRSLGTPLYMSPEQFRAQRVTPASDIFALALVAYTLLVGEAYWELEASAGGDVIAFALKTASGPTEAPTVRAARRGVTLPPGFDGWFLRATAVDPAQRPPTATACVAALGQAYGLDPGRLSGVASPDPLALSGASAAMVSVSPSLRVLGAAPVNTVAAVTFPGPSPRPSRLLPTVVLAGAILVGGVGARLYFSRANAAARPLEAVAAPGETAAASATEAPVRVAASASATAPAGSAAPALSALSSPAARPPTAKAGPVKPFTPPVKPGAKPPAAGYSQD